PSQISPLPPLAVRPPSAQLLYAVYAHHQGQPSFPTRRSSDLIEAGGSLAGGHSIADSEVKYGLSVTGTIHPDSIRANNTGHVGEDRKSTRLNSSHVSISYAVFCLKKKRNRLKGEAIRETVREV